MVRKEVRESERSTERVRVDAPPPGSDEETAHSASGDEPWIPIDPQNGTKIHQFGCRQLLLHGQSAVFRADEQASRDALW